VVDDAAIKLRFEALDAVLDERGRRLFAAAEALAAGRGGVLAASRVTGLARSTIGRGLAELRGTVPPTVPGRIRRKGGGRKALVATDATLLADLKDLVEPTTRGDPMAPLLWTAKSLRNLAAGLRDLGHRISHNAVADLLRTLGYSLQANRKTLEGTNHPDRDAQFEYINDQVKQALVAREPAISVDTKKKELVGDFKNAGREYHPKGRPEPVRVHDFVIPELGRAAPYGVPHGEPLSNHDIAGNTGWVSLGIDHDTASFAVQAIRRWWRVMGRPVYRHAQSLLITADAGGSNGARLRLWKWELQRLANRTGLTITVCHFPPGTSKWNKIEHRLFSHIAMNWRGTPLVNLATIVSLIGTTHSRSGLRVRSELDRGHYPSGVAVTDAQMAIVRLERHRFHGDWNYTIHPATTRRHRVLVS